MNTTTNASDIVINCLMGRRGFDEWWHNIDSQIQAEILAEIDFTLYERLMMRGGVKFNDNEIWGKLG